MNKRRRRRSQLLSSTRPSKQRSSSSLSSSTIRGTIRTHHTLRKQLSSALAKRDVDGARTIESHLDKAGGILAYQHASTQGQSAQRGGDTSKILVNWLSGSGSYCSKDDKQEKDLRLLDIGALRVDNAYAKSGMFQVERIDSHSQHPLIAEQDFMKRPIPEKMDLGREGFDVVCLSLVVNFVGDPIQRGEMLRRVGLFLRSQSGATEHLPALFLVLPASCVTNSRYFNEDRLELMMTDLGYKIVERKMSMKLVYYLWQFKGMKDTVKKVKKQEIRTGKSRNNFTIVLR